ncbi:MAG TPA: hypothetical protein VE843_08210 [Ktedonobacteraceae bacterium]|nr:hypothetical protein [Ktedonobacteraceae bacterium]
MLPELPLLPPPELSPLPLLVPPDGGGGLPPIGLDGPPGLDVPVERLNGLDGPDDVVGHFLVAGIVEPSGHFLVVVDGLLLFPFPPDVTVLGTIPLFFCLATSPAW